MFIKWLPMIIIVGLVSINGLWADVPATNTHIPAVPNFLEPLFFQTVESMVFPPEASGMVSDPFSDLAWNPAFVLRPQKKMIYLDYSAHNETPSLLLGDFSKSFGTTARIPNEEIRTEMYGIPQPVNNQPLVNIAAIIPISKRLSLGILNKTTVDRQPFLDAWYAPKWDSYYDHNRNLNDFDENSQTASGVQTEISLGYSFGGGVVDVGARFGYYRYSRSGDFSDLWREQLLDETIDNSNGVSLDSTGEHTDLGLGVVLHIGSSTQLGVSVGQTNGDCDEGFEFMETRDQHLEGTYYYYTYDRFYENDFLSNGNSWNGNESSGHRDYFTVTLEQTFGPKWTIRSFLSYSDYTATSDGSVDFKYLREDNDFDTYQYSSGNRYYLDHYIYDRTFNVQGSGRHDASRWQWFASAIYHPSKNWSFFSGVQLQHYRVKEEFQEKSVYQYNYTHEDTGTYPDLWEKMVQWERNYQVNTEFDQWRIYLPLGMKVSLNKKLELLLGADLTLTVSNADQTGDEVYPLIIEKYWDEGEMEASSAQTDVRTTYRDHSPKVLDRQVRHHVGLTYHAAKGLDIYLRSFGNIFDTANWSFGLMYRW